MTRRLRCLHVIDSLGRGGAEQGLVNILQPLRDAGIDSEVVALYDPPTLAEDLASAGFPVHRLELARRWDPAAILRIASLCRSGSFDIVQSHLAMATLYVGLSRPLAPRPRRVALYLNLDYDVHPGRTAKQRARKWFQGWIARTMIDEHVAVSEETARHFERHLGLRKVGVIPLSVPDSLVDAPRSAAPRQPSDRTTLLTPARFVHQKGHRYLVAALRLVRDRGLEPKAIFVGDGPLFADVQAQVDSLGLRDLVEVRRAVRHDELLELLADVDVVVLPSLQEGLPVAALEAMACGRALIASAVSGLRELVVPGRTGLLVPPGDPRALADAIEAIVSSVDDRTRLGGAAAALVKERYTASVVASKWAAFYRGLC
ncbi:MAG: glycosyltransferase family 4 protein [Elusimicrobia bacterium]|nr:glycosyltransferase family 4 protein [Elusimicrobiota bacterium]